MLIAKLQGSACQTIQDSYDIVFDHLVERGLQVPNPKNQKDQIVVKFLKQHPEVMLECVKFNSSKNNISKSSLLLESKGGPSRK